MCEAKGIRLCMIRFADKPYSGGPTRGALIIAQNREGLVGEVPLCLHENSMTIRDHGMEIEGDEEMDASDLLH